MRREEEKKRRREEEKERRDKRSSNNCSNSAFVIEESLSTGGDWRGSFLAGAFWFFLLVKRYKEGGGKGRN